MPQGRNRDVRRDRRNLLALCGFLLLALAAGCRDNTPRIKPLEPAAVVLAFGDSLTYGTGADSRESYPERLAQRIGHKVVNAGVPGEVSEEGLARLPEVLDRYQPALLILCHGGNDLLRRTGEGRAAQNLRSMVRLARERGIDVVLLGVPRPDLSLEPPSYYGEIASEFSIPYEGDILPDILSDRSLKSDYIHPNSRGYQRLADAVADLLRRGRAL